MNFKSVRTIVQGRKLLDSLTPAAHAAVLRKAEQHSPAFAAAVALMRTEKGSRVENIVTQQSGSNQRRYYSSWTGAFLDSESSRYRMTKHAEQAVKEEEERVVALMGEKARGLIRAINERVEA